MKDTFNEHKPENWHHTKYDLMQAHKAKGINYNIKWTEDHMRNAQQARHNTFAQRQRLGIAKGSEYGQSKIDEISFGAAALNFIVGLSFEASASSECFYSVETLLFQLDTNGRIIRKLYIPQYMSELQLNVQDIIASGSSAYVTCYLSKLFITLTAILTTEGISEFVSRVFTNYPFDISRAQDMWNNPDAYELAERFQLYGRVFSSLLDYYI